MRLRDFAADVHSQCGEDGIIEHIFEDVLFYIDPDEPRGTEDPIPEPRTDFFAVEFGGSDDLLCSNVANLWKNKGWSALLIEADSDRAAALRTVVNHQNVEVLNSKVEPTGANSIDAILEGRMVDFMSIDIDGNDYHVWRTMRTMPLVLCIEFNPTVPPHISVHQEYDPESMMGFGSSLKAFIELSLTKGYTFLGATEINAFFVLDRLSLSFSEYEREMPSYRAYTYLVTDFLGHAIAVGKNPPWGIHQPYVGPTLTGDFFSITTSPKQTMDAYEAKYGQVVRWYHEGYPNIANPDFIGPIPGGKIRPISARNLLRAYCEAKKSPICIAIAHIAPEQADWVKDVAAEQGYHYQYGGGVLTLLRRA